MNYFLITLKAISTIIEILEFFVRYNECTEWLCKFFN